jgi:type II restriction enzyme
VAEKHRLRLNRAGTILNLTSRQQESALGKALKGATAQLLDEFELKLIHNKSWPLSRVVERLATSPRAARYSTAWRR